MARRADDAHDGSACGLPRKLDAPRTANANVESVREINRAQLEELVTEAARVSGQNELILIGSQCVHAATAHVPPEVVMSLECDLLLEGNAAVAVRDALGPKSPYHVSHGTYADVVSPEFPFLSRAWETRLQALEAGAAIGKCLEVHDLSISKLAAGRLKDFELVAALIAQKLADRAREHRLS